MNPSYSRTIIMDKEFQYIDILIIRTVICVQIIFYVNERK